MGRGRKPILQDRKTTCISLDGKHMEYLQTHNMELSVFIRDQIDLLIESDEAPIEQLKREIEEIKGVIQENELKLHQKEKMLEDLETTQEAMKIEEQKQTEFEIKKKDYVIKYIQNMRTAQTCNRYWLEHMVEAWKFKNFDEAKSYVRNVWREEGVPDKRIKAFLMMN